MTFSINDIEIYKRIHIRTTPKKNKKMNRKKIPRKEKLKIFSICILISLSLWIVQNKEQGEKTKKKKLFELYQRYKPEIKNYKYISKGS